MYFLCALGKKNVSLTFVFEIKWNLTELLKKNYMSVVSMSLSVLTYGSAEVPCNITHIDSFVIKVIQIRVPCQNVQVSVNKVTLTDTWLYRIPPRIHATLCPHWQ